MQAAGVESLWDEILPVEVKALPADLQALDALLTDAELLSPIAVRWERLLAEAGRQAGRGRPTIAMETYVRLMIVKHRSGWGYETLMREVSDSIHLRRFCRIGLTDRVPDESTVRKLTRRLGAEVVHEITRELTQKARREKRFPPAGSEDRLDRRRGGRPLADRRRLAADGVKALAREGRKLAAKIGEKRTSVRDRSRSMGRKLRSLTRTIRKRTGEAKREVLILTDQTGQLLEASIKETRKLAATARRRARPPGFRRRRPAAQSPLPLPDWLSATIGRRGRAVPPRRGRRELESSKHRLLLPRESSGSGSTIAAAVSRLTQSRRAAGCFGGGAGAPPAAVTSKFYELRDNLRRCASEQALTVSGGPLLFRLAEQRCGPRGGRR